MMRIPSSVFEEKAHTAKVSAIHHAAKEFVQTPSTNRHFPNCSSLHVILKTLRRRSSKVPHIDIIILLQLL